MLLGGNPLELIEKSSAAAAIPDELRFASEVIEYPVRVPDAEAEALVCMANQLASYRRLIAEAAAGGNAEFPAEVDSLWDLPRLAEAALDWGREAVEQHGALLVLALQGPPARDLMMLLWATTIAVGDQS